VLWPAVPLVVEERMVGLAFGIVTSMQNLVTTFRFLKVYYCMGSVYANQCSATLLTARAVR
jgi:hypothetical protein